MPRPESYVSPPLIDVFVLWQYRLAILASLFAGVGAGFAYIKLVPATYQAQARVLVEPRGLTPETESAGRVTPEFLPTQAETLRSPVTIARALESVSVIKPEGADSQTFDPILHVLKSLQVTPILKANVLTVGYQSTSSDEAVAVISAVIESYRSMVNEDDRSTWASNVEMIASRERELRQDLEALQKEYSELRRSNPLIGEGRDVAGIALARLNELGNQITETKRQQIDLRSRIDAVDGVLPAVGASQIEGVAGPDESPNLRLRTVVALKPVPVPSETTQTERILQHAAPDEARQLEELDRELRDTKLRVKQLDAVYGQKHPDMIASQARIIELEEMIQQRLLGFVRSWKRDLQGLESAEKSLSALYQAEQERTKEADVYFVKEQMLHSNLAQVEELHASTLAQLEEIQAADKAIGYGRNSIVVRVLDEPRLLDNMIWPKKKEILAVSGCLGLIVGFCCVWLRESLRAGSVVAEPGRVGRNGGDAVADTGEAT